MMKQIYINMLRWILMPYICIKVQDWEVWLIRHQVLNLYPFFVRKLRRKMLEWERVHGSMMKSELPEQVQTCFVWMVLVLAGKVKKIVNF